MKINNSNGVASYYNQRKVAEQYLARRFTEPLNRIEHQRQVSILNQIIAATNSQKILEFAPGPARVTAELSVENGISIDNSKHMLELARQRMADLGKRWTFLQADIFTLKLKPQYDLIFSFRFLLHFKSEDRKKIYHQAYNFLKPRGYFVFEAMNRRTVLPLRKLLGRNRYFIYDKLYTRRELIQEMESNGFKVLQLYPILTNFWWQAFLSRPFKLLHFNKAAEKLILFLEKNKSKSPYQWLALSQKKAAKNN